MIEDSSLSETEGQRPRNGIKPYLEDPDSKDGSALAHIKTQTQTHSYKTEGPREIFKTKLDGN